MESLNISRCSSFECIPLQTRLLKTQISHTSGGEPIRNLMEGQDERRDIVSIGSVNSHSILSSIDSIPGLEDHPEGQPLSASRVFREADNIYRVQSW